MKMLAVKNFSTSHLYFFPADLTRSVYFHFLSHCHYFPYLVLAFVFNLIVILVAVTSEDVYWSMRNVKFINKSFHNMRCLVMFITAISIYTLSDLGVLSNLIGSLSLAN